MNKRICSVSLVAALAALTAAPAVDAQQPVDVQQPDDDPLQWRVRGGVVHQLDSDIDSGGEFNVTRAGFDAQALYDFNTDLTLDAEIGYEFNSYDFSGSTGFGALNPWDDVHTVRIRTLLRWRMNEEWSFVGGPIFEFAAEDGADLSDGFNVGGVVSAAYRVHDDLTLGGGVLLVSEIEDDVAVFPVIIVNWRISDQWRVRNSLAPFGGYGGGLEAVWTLSENWDLAFGTQFQWRQFKLDDTGTAPNGVGEEFSIPLYVNARWKATPNVSISAAIGVSVGGEVEIQTSSGSTISNEDYDPTAIIALSASITF